MPLCGPSRRKRRPGWLDAAATAAVECAAGALSRAFASAEVSGPAWAKRAISPAFLGAVGRELVRSGQSLAVIDVSALGELALLPASSWDFQGEGTRPDGWTVQAVVNGPSEAVTLYRPWPAVVFVSWGYLTGRPFAGRGPLDWAHTSARLQAEVERSLADEAGGPVANLLTVPQDGGDGTEADPLAELKSDIRAARGRALLLETTSGGYGEGRSAAPLRDWKPERLGPEPPASMDSVMGRAFVEVLGACGCPAGLFVERADGTAQRESYRRFFSLTVRAAGGLGSRRAVGQAGSRDQAGILRPVRGRSRGPGAGVSIDGWGRHGCRQGGRTGRPHGAGRVGAMMRADSRAKLGFLQLFELERGRLSLVVELEGVKQNEVPNFRQSDQLAVWRFPELPPEVTCSDAGLLKLWSEDQSKVSGGVFDGQG